jgi:hypothetical protein
MADSVADTPPIAQSARNLERLYTVAIGLALTVAITSLISPTSSNPLRAGMLPQFLAFFATLLPFYHGAMRHLDRWYVEERGANVRSGALLADSLMLFVEGCILVAMAILLPRPFAFGWFLVTLLAFDAIWGASTYLIFAREKRIGAELRWVAINLVVTPVLLAIILVFDVTDVPVRAALAAVAAARSSIDYALSWSFYFPRAGVPERG